VVLIDGFTVVEPLRATDPIPLSIVTDVAFEEVHDSVTVPPAVTVDGCADNWIVGAAPPEETVIVAELLAVALPAVAVAVYVVVAVGVTIMDPFSATEPTPLSIVTPVPLVLVHDSVTCVPALTVEGWPVNVTVGAAVDGSDEVVELPFAGTPPQPHKLSVAAITPKSDHLQSDRGRKTCNSAMLAFESAALGRVAQFGPAAEAGTHVSRFVTSELEGIALGTTRFEVSSIDFRSIRGAGLSSMLLNPGE